MLGGAKRVSMANHIIRAASRLGLKARMFSFELDRAVPIAQVAEVVTGGRWSDKDILQQLDRVCRENGIDIILPFVDGAVEVAARYCKRNPSVWSPVSEEDVCKCMFDKLLADRLFRENDIPLPEIVTADEPEFFPIIAKPRTGSASKGIIVIDNLTQWQQLDIKKDNFIIQKYISPHREYTLDCYIDRNGVIKAISPRLRKEVVGGEVSRTVTVDLPRGIIIAKEAIEAAKLRGAVTIQLIEDMKTGDIMLMEVNPRLGGGAVCSIYAGVDLPKMIIQDWLGENIAYQQPKTGIEMTRYMQEVVFDCNNDLCVKI